MQASIWAGRALQNEPSPGKPNLQVGMNLTAWSQICFISLVMIFHDKSLGGCCVPFRILPICIRIVRTIEQLPPFPVAGGVSSRGCGMWGPQYSPGSAGWGLGYARGLLRRSAACKVIREPSVGGVKPAYNPVPEPIYMAAPSFRESPGIPGERRADAWGRATHDPLSYPENSSPIPSTVVTPWIT